LCAPGTIFTIGEYVFDFMFFAILTSTFSLANSANFLDLPIFVSYPFTFKVKR